MLIVIMEQTQEKTLQRESISVEIEQSPTPFAELDETVKLALACASEKKAFDLVGLDLREIASFTEFFIIASGSNQRQVQAIADEIEVRHPSDKKRSDDEIAKRAIVILDWDTVVPTGAVQVIVRGGWVTLTGKVDWQYQKKAAEECVRKLSGLQGVINNIEIRPHVKAQDVQQKIEDALKRHAEVEAKGIRVIVRDNDKVLLEGTVGNWDERYAVENAAWSAPGVKSVEDRLAIA